MEQAVATLLGGPSGSFFYHLLVLLAIEAGLALSYDAYRRSRDAEERSLVWAWGGMLAVQTATVAVAAFEWMGGNLAGSGFFSLEQAAEAMTLFLLVWGFVLAPQFSGRLAWVTLGLGVTLCLGGGVLAHPEVGLLDGAPTWPSLALGFLAVGVLLVWRRPRDRWNVLAFLGVLGVAATLQVAVGAASEPPFWQRLGQLVALPAAVVTTYGIARRAPSHAAFPVVLEEPGSGSRLRRLLAFFEAFQQADVAPDLPSALERLVEGVAKGLQTDECALVLAEDGAAETLRLGAIYNPGRTGRGEVVSLPLREQHILRKALRQQKPVSIPNAQELVQLQILLALMGASGSGPVLILPLDLEGGPGAIVASRTQTRREFSAEEEELGMRLAAYASEGVRAARRTQALEQQIAGLKAELRNREIEMQEQWVNAQKQIARGKSEAEYLSQRLYELEKELAEREEELKGAHLEAAQKVAEAGRAREEAEALARKLEQAVRERMQLEERLQAAGGAEDQEGEGRGSTG
ncbi:MAG: GAF domain-containing protein [Anaerolineae bacterium]